LDAAINKPVGMSSAQVIRDCQAQFNPSRMFALAVQQEREKMEKEPKRAWKRRSQVKREARVKMGHGGTLDPLASGVLILGINGGCKSMTDFLECTKVYETIIVFGVATDSYDRVGRIVLRKPYEGITMEIVAKALPAFKGTITQTPPVYSALKMDGKPLYEYAREGKPLPRAIPTRQVEVKEMELLEWFEPGTHKHYWPTEEASDAEKDMVEKLWEEEDQQHEVEDEPAQHQSQEEKEEAEAIAAHEAVKRKFDTDVDELVKDRPKAKRPKLGFPIPKGGPPMMSGALGATANSYKPGKGSNLIPATDDNAPPPWEDKGPPAAKIRMTVTSGFYVRSFCHDLGRKVGSLAIMAELLRSRQGDFTIDGPNCLDYDDLAREEEVWAPKVEAMLANWAAKTGSIRKGASTNVNAGGKSEAVPADAETKAEAKADEKIAEEQDEDAQMKDGEECPAAAGPSPATQIQEQQRLKDKETGSEREPLTAAS
jgi:tRNA pseudouridine55 synthase